VVNCPNCGKELPDVAAFCSECGLAIEQQKESYLPQPFIPEGVYEDDTHCMQVVIDNTSYSDQIPTNCAGVWASMLIGLSPRPTIYAYSISLDVITMYSLRDNAVIRNHILLAPNGFKLVDDKATFTLIAPLKK